ncbi:TonB-dependent receptor [Cytophagales bacterium LB-30]|uniref:TonB-dependent receptor n=1 Tax=Shiella aurantiaca TaxID=3058365 RepID=A0ABT8F4I4_9BACT|nr:TonB-dependent receptor [Shiella aurantiaca]
MLAQTTLLKGKVLDANNKPVAEADVFIENTAFITQTNAQGEFQLSFNLQGDFVLAVFKEGLKSERIPIQTSALPQSLIIRLEALEQMLEQVTIESERGENGLRRLNSIEGTSIYEAKKTEVIILKDIDANLATNNARQVYAKVSGLNIWESDGAGIQLGIGGRGLSPNRTSNFNTRQNGYDISADALGYPESYYTPPAEALESIEVVRGAASLQYGTQFGGMLNFVMKRGPEDKKIEVTTRQSVGSWGLFNSFNSVGGKLGGLDYYVYYQRKQGNGWRPNSGFEVDNLFADFNWQLTDKLFVCVEYTHMNYLAQQPGGLSDAFYAEDPRQSIRERNWFKVDWNLFANIIEYKFNDKTKLNIRTFGLIAGRDALGNLGLITRGDDLTAPRNLLTDDYRNWGSEARLAHYFSLGSQLGAFVVGGRYYEGHSTKQQGFANASKNPDFFYLNPENPGESDYRFPSQNVAGFIETILPLSEKITVTPGIRFEHIVTRADGYYNLINRDNAGNIIFQDTIFENRTRERSFVLGGIGLSYKPNDRMEVYANFSQNYRAINFNDIRVVNPNISVDPNIQDEEGYNADLGIRGKLKPWFQVDYTVFYLRYNDRIGAILTRELDPNTGVNRIVRRRSNIADAEIVGIESFMEVQMGQWLFKKPVHRLSVFTNIALLSGRYLNSQEAAAEGKKVELIPGYNLKTGANYKWRGLSVSGQFTAMGEQYTDATNAIASPDAVSGIIPSYYVADLSASYAWKNWKLESGINNLTDNRYFTRRAEGYPGPGIIPADGRNYYIALQFKLGY